MRIYKVRGFARFQRRERIADEALVKAVADASNGLIEADLGGGLIKQRIARTGQGKSGGYRTIIAYRREQRAVFLFGFAKSDLETISNDELETLKARGRTYLELRAKQLAALAAEGDLVEVSNSSEE